METTGTSQRKSSPGMGGFKFPLEGGCGGMRRALTRLCTLLGRGSGGVWIRKIRGFLHRLFHDWDHLDREPFSLDAARCLSRVESGQIEGWLCATTVTTRHYLIRKSTGTRNAFESITLLLSFFEIASVNKTVLVSALSLPFKDFEVAVLHEAARFSKVDVIVTRNTSDFKKSSVPVQLPGDLRQK